jgi:Holliday junction resolvasome RuvABC endonuclease subunit
MEKVSSSPQMGVVSAFSFGKSQGFLIGLLTAMKIPYHEVTPQKWQKAMGCMSGGDKNVTKHAAQKLWPHLKITHRDADARLIAEYGRRFINVGGTK